MKKREKVWEGAWKHVKSLDYLSSPLRRYGFENMVWCLTKLLKNETPANILDVGCGIGKYFQTYHELGFNNICGMEYDQANVEQCRFLCKIPSVDIRQGDIKDLPQPYGKETFDVVTSFGLVEHYHNPAWVIKKLLDTTKPNGVLLLEMPNFQNFSYYLHHLAKRKTMPFHLWFGPKHWSKVINRIPNCQIEDIQTAKIWGYEYLSRIPSAISKKAMKIQISLENRLFKKSGSLCFYKIRKLS